MGRRCFVGGVVLWDELCRQSVHGWVGGTGRIGGHCPSWWTSCSLVGCVLQGVIFSDLWPYQRVSLCSQKILRSQAQRGSSSSWSLTSAQKCGSRDAFLNPNSVSISQHHRALDPSVLLRSGWFYLILAQWFCLRPASLGRPFMRCCRVSVVQRRLQRTVPVVARRTELAAAVGVVIWNGRRSFHYRMGGTIGLN